MSQPNETQASIEAPYPSNFYAWYCVIVLLGIYLNSFLDRQILGLIVGPMKSTMELSDSEVGFLMGPSFAIFYTIAGLPLGWLADRVSRRWLIAVGQLFWSLASVGFGLSRSYTQMIGARIGVGVGEASLSPSAYSFIADTFPPNRLARAMSVYSMGIYVGGGLANLVGGQLTGYLAPDELHTMPIVGERFGWQIIFFAIATPTIPLTLLLLTLREPTRRGLAVVRDAAGKVQAVKVPIRDFLTYAKENRRTILTHGFGFSFLSFSGYGAAAWMPAYFMRIHGWTPKEAGTYLGLAGMLVGPLGLISAGWFADRLNAKGYRDSKMRVGVMCATAWFPFGILMPLMPTAELSFAMLIPATFFAAMPWGIAPAAIQEIMPNQMRGQASAVYLFIINLVGLGLGPQVLALVTDYVFADENQVHLSLLWTTTLAHVFAAALLLYGLSAFRKSRDYCDAWLEKNSR
ncbi:MAG: MFS transporter [Myxococcales bacterium]|nr:MFS transporter [Myxococcales bacterium]